MQRGGSVDRDRSIVGSAIGRARWPLIDTNERARTCDIVAESLAVVLVDQVGRGQQQIGPDGCLRRLPVGQHDGRRRRSIARRSSGR